MPKIKGPSSSPLSAKPPETSKPPASTRPPETSKPPAASTRPADGFSTRPSGPVAQTQPKPPGGQDVTASFVQDPVKFASQPGNVLNVSNTQRPPGVPAATPQQPFVNASDSIVTMSAHQRPGGNANLHLGPANGPGAQVHYLDYLPEGSGRFAGLQGVPMHPGPKDPKMVVTGQLNGCAVHAMHDSRDQSLSFLHHANYSKNGPQEYKDFLGQHPHLSPAATFEPKDYSHRTGYRDETTGATAFAHYQPSTSGKGLGEWRLMGQLNDQAGTNMQDMRPDLKRPGINAPPLMMVPLQKAPWAE